MKIATYNVNGITGRLPVLLRWLKQEQPEIACFQELRASQDKFPEAALKAAGYGAIWRGQKSWNGVAILSKLKFDEIHRGLPQISRTLLATRLRQLEDAGVVTAGPAARGGAHEYGLTEAGEEFRPVVEGLGAWGQRWTVRVDTNNLDAGFLMWNLQRRIAVEQLPAQHLLVEFRFRNLPERHRGAHIFWLVLARPDVELCLKDPGADVDLLVDADLRAFAQFWLGDRSLNEVVSDKSVHLAGRRELVRAFPSWLLRSHFSAVPR